MIPKNYWPSSSSWCPILMVPLAISEWNSDWAKNQKKILSRDIYRVVFYDPNLFGWKLLQNGTPFILDHQDMYLVCIDAVRNKPCSIKGFLLINTLLESHSIQAIAVSHIGWCRFNPNIIDCKTWYQHGWLPNEAMMSSYIESLKLHKIYAPLYRGNIYWNLNEQEELIEYAIDCIKSIYNEKVILENIMNHNVNMITLSFRSIFYSYKVTYSREISNWISCTSDNKVKEFINWRFNTIEQEKLV